MAVALPPVAVEVLLLPEVELDDALLFDAEFDVLFAAEFAVLVLPDGVLVGRAMHSKVIPSTVST